MPPVDASHGRLLGTYTLETRKINRPRVAGGQYQYEVPRLVVSGRALEAAGFHKGDVVIVTCPRPGALVVQRATPQGAAGAASSRRAS